MLFLFPFQLTTWPHKLLNCCSGGRSNQPGGKLFRHPRQLLLTERGRGAAASQEIPNSTQLSHEEKEDKKE